MSPALNLLSNNLQVYGPSTLPCLGVSGRAVGISPCSQSQRRTLHMSMTSPKCYLRHKSFVCKARFGGQGRDSDFSGQNRHGFSRSWARLNDERGDSDDLGESESLSAKNEQLPSHSNSEKHHGIAAPRPRNREIEEQIKEIEKNDSLLWPVEEKLAVDQEKRRASMFSRRYHGRAVRLLSTLMREFHGEKELDEKSGETHSEPDLGAEAESDSELNMDLNSGLELDQEEDEEEELEEDLGAEAESDSELDMDLNSGLELDQEEDEEEELEEEDEEEDEEEELEEEDKEEELEEEDEEDEEEELELEEEDEEEELEEEDEEELEEEEEEDEEEELEAAVQSETDPVIVRTAEEDELIERLREIYVNEEDLTASKVLNVLKLDELREFARFRGMKGYSELTKSELVDLLCEDAM